MKAPLVAVLQDFRNILGVCPHCGELFRLTDIQISYHAKPRHTWLDELEAHQERIQRAEERFEEREEAIRESARERGRRQLPRLLRKADPVFSGRGYFPQDVKPLFDPIDFVIFDGMNRKGHVKRVVLFDGPPDDRPREKIQRSITRAIRAGNYEWKTVRMDKDGGIRQ
jgi:predicted Holliday junction resolvase-like endonuclease